VRATVTRKAHWPARETPSGGVGDGAAGGVPFRLGDRRAFPSHRAQDVLGGADGVMQLQAGETARDQIDLPWSQQYFAQLGLVLGATYRSAAVLADDSTADIGTEYVPTSKPGHRMPHLWLTEHRSALDAVGEWFTLFTPDPRRVGAADHRTVAHADRDIGPCRSRHRPVRHQPTGSTARSTGRLHRWLLARRPPRDSALRHALTIITRSAST
jgi:hypothetical protein